MVTSPTHTAVVVCESMFGNTRALADAVAGVLGDRFDQVEVYGIDDAPVWLEGVDLLVVGAPTHAFGMSRPSTRQGAGEQGATAVSKRGAREWIAALAPTPAPLSVAVFDTRIRKPFLVGSAARAMRRRFRRRGDRVVAATSFTVTGTPGPLAAGELERAARWAATLAPATEQAARRS